MPPGVRLEDVKATFADGVLEVSVPLPAKPEPAARKVEIEEPKKAARTAAISALITRAWPRLPRRRKMVSCLAASQPSDLRGPIARPASALALEGVDEDAVRLEDVVRLEGRGLVQDGGDAVMHLQFRRHAVLQNDARVSTVDNAWGSL